MELKDRIIDESSKLFFHNGIKSITMSDIANQLGISKRTLYEIFNDKEDLLENCLNVNIEKGDKETEILFNESENVIDALMRIYAKYVNDACNIHKSVMHDLRKYHPKLYKMIEQKQKEDINVFVPLFEKGIKQGLIRNDLNIEVLVWILKAQFRTLWEFDFLPIDKFSFNEYLEAIIFNFTRGIATPSGSDKIDEYIQKLKMKK